MKELLFNFVMVAIFIIGVTPKLNDDGATSVSNPVAVAVVTSTNTKTKIQKLSRNHVRDWID